MEGIWPSSFGNFCLADPCSASTPSIPSIQSILSIGSLWKEKKDISGERASGLALQHQFRKSYDEVVVAGLQRARQPSSRNRFRSGTETTSFSGRFNADASHSSAPRMSSRSYAVD